MLDTIPLCEDGTARHQWGPASDLGYGDGETLTRCERCGLDRLRFPRKPLMSPSTYYRLPADRSAEQVKEEPK